MKSHSMLLLNFAYGIHFLRHGMLFPLIPLYAEQMGARPGGIGMVVSAFSLLTLFLAIPAGRLADRVNAPALLTAGAGCNLVYAVLLLLAGSVWGLAAAQLIGGLGFLLLIISSQTYVTGFQATADRERGFGQLALVSAVGHSLGPFLGGLVLARFGFEAVYGLALGLAVPGLAGGLVRPQPRAPTAPSTGLHGQKLSHLLGDTRILAILAFTFGILFVVSLRNSFLPILLQERGFGEDRIGLLISIFALAMTGIRLVIGRLMGRVSRGVFLWTAIGCVLAGAAVLPLLSDLWTVAAMLALMGLGFGISQPLSMVMMSDLTQGPGAGSAMGLRFFTLNLGLFTSPLILGWVVDWYGLEAAFGSAAGLLALVGVLIWGLGLGRRSGRKS